MGEIHNYAKVHEAVQAFCEWSLSSIQSCIEQWHQHKLQTLSPCLQTSCPSYKKPSTKSGACQNCIDWGNAVEAECHPPASPGRGVQWKNVNATMLHKDPVEVAKGFVFIIPHAQSCSSFDDFDVGGILKMMLGFKCYHNGNQVIVDRIQKVVDIRNSLSHMKVKAKMHISDTQMNAYFKDITDLVTDLGGQHACLTSGTILALLKRIQQSDVNIGVLDRAIKPLTDGLHQALEQTLHQHFQQMQMVAFMSMVEDHFRELQLTVEEGSVINEEAREHQTHDWQEMLKKGKEEFDDLKRYMDSQTHHVEQVVLAGNNSAAEALHQQSRDLKQHIDESTRDIKQTVEEGITRGAEAALNRFHAGSLYDQSGSDHFDAEAVRHQLMAEYKQTRSQVQLLPGIPEECKSMDDIFVDIRFCEPGARPGVEIKNPYPYRNIPLPNMERRYPSDLLNITDKHGGRMKRILVKGDPGCGKSTLISKIAYDWAKNENHRVYTQFQLVFALDMKEVPLGVDLFDVIQDQLLPNVRKEDLERFVQSHAESVLFLFDGYDETIPAFPGSCIYFKGVLSSRVFPDSVVVLTTRPHKVAEISTKYKTHYTLVDVFGLPMPCISMYVSQFFNIDLLYIDWYSNYKNMHRPWVSLEWHNLPGKFPEPPETLKKEVERVSSLMAQIHTSEKLLSMCRFPLLLTMVCFLWTEGQDVSLILSNLYREAVVHVAKTRCKRHGDDDLDDQSIRQQVDSLLLKVGKVALDGLLENKILFTAKHFDSDTLKEACDVGVLSKERKRSKLSSITYVTFVHKTFQEMSAAYYWASLAGSDDASFQSYWKQIGDMEDNEMLLRFCCGESCRAAELILSQVIDRSCTLTDHLSRSTDKCFLSHYRRELDPWRLPLILLFEVEQKAGLDEVKHLHSLFKPLVSKLNVLAECRENVHELWAVMNIFARKVISRHEHISWFAYVDDVHITDPNVTGNLGCRSQIRVQKVPDVALAVSCMSNLKSLTMDSSCSSGDCSSVLQRLIATPTASTSLTQFTYRYDFEPQVMADFLSRQQSLKCLEIVNSFPDIEKSTEEIKNLALSIGNRSTPLEVLILDDLPLHQHVCWLEPLIPHLKELQLTHDNMEGRNDHDTCKTLFEMVSSTKRRLPLVKLTVQSNNQRNTGQSLAMAVRHLPDLECLALRRHLFAFKEGMEEGDFKIFGPSLKHLPKLTELDLCGNTVGQSVKELGNGIRHLTKLQVLHLSGGKLTESSAEFLPLECLPELKDIWLGNNKIGKGMALLSEKLKSLENLREIEFCNAHLTDEDVALLSLSKFKQLISLDLSFNLLWSKGLCAISEHMENMPKLEELRLQRQHEDISDEVAKGIRHAEGVEALLRNAKHASSLTKMFVPGIYVSRYDYDQSECLQTLSHVLSSKEILHDGQKFVKLDLFPTHINDIHDHLCYGTCNSCLPTTTYDSEQGTMTVRYRSRSTITVK